MVYMVQVKMPIMKITAVDICTWPHSKHIEIGHYSNDWTN